MPAETADSSTVESKSGTAPQTDPATVAAKAAADAQAQGGAARTVAAEAAAKAAADKAAADAKGATDAKAAADNPAPEKPAADATTADESTAAKAAKPKSLLTDEKAEEPATSGDQAKADDWKLTLPEKSVLTAKDLAAVETFAKTEKLTKVQAEKLLAREAATRVARVAEYEALYSTWEAEAKKHPVIGGDKLPAAVANAKRALSLASPAFREMVANSPFSNHPEFLAFLAGIGATLKEDAVIGNSGKPPAPKSVTERFYGKDHRVPSAGITVS